MRALIRLSQMTAFSSALIIDPYSWATPPEPARPMEQGPAHQAHLYYPLRVTAAIVRQIPGLRMSPLHKLLHSQVQIMPEMSDLKLIPTP